jgi:hypothetical protein
VQKDLNDESETILLIAPDGTNELEIYITSFNDEGKPITAERLRTESHLNITNDSPIIIGTVQGVQFDLVSDNSLTHQAWFEYQGYLYQAESYTTNANLLEQVLGSWRFAQ